MCMAAKIGAMLKQPCTICMAGVLLCAMSSAIAEVPPETPADSDANGVISASSASSPSNPSNTSDPASTPAVPHGPVWITNVGAASSSTSGNTDTRNLNLLLDTQRSTEFNKLSITAEFVKSSADVVEADTGKRHETTTAFRELGRVRYDHNLSERVFAFGGLELAHDRIALINLRQVYSTGFGYQFLLRSEQNTWDVLGGLSYRDDRYRDQGVEIDGRLREELQVHELMFGEESSHDITPSIQFQQKLTVNRSVGEVQGTRGQFDMGLQIALNRTLSLSMKLQRRYDGMARAPVERYDTLVFTGINMKFGG
jgi:putative salt-induced outer membrane protein